MTCKYWCYFKFHVQSNFWKSSFCIFQYTVCFLQRKINIQLKYFPEKFGNSGESNSCPSSPIKRSKCWRYGHAPSWKFLIITCKILHILSMFWMYEICKYCVKKVYLVLTYSGEKSSLFQVLTWPRILHQIETMSTRNTISGNW